MTDMPVLSIEQISCVPVRLDFRMGVAHSLASRNHSINVCVVAVSENGLVGIGEGVPRDYVTGETLASSVAALEELTEAVDGRRFVSPDELVAYLTALGATDTAVANPAAMCAVELALLDLAGRYWNMPVSDILGLEIVTETLAYSLVVPLMPEKAVRAFLNPAGEYGFGHVKIKVDGTSPAARVALVRDILGPEVELRVDANCAWNRKESLVFAEELAGLGVVCFEQPLSSDDFEGMAYLRKHANVSIALDESVGCPDDVKRAADSDACDIVNVRISKCGGLLGALRVIDAAEMCGLGIQLGAQVGESCVLSAAGALLASATPSFRWLEGAFGCHLLVDDLCERDFRFGPRGMLIPPSGSGLGLSVSTDRVNAAARKYAPDTAV